MKNNTLELIRYLRDSFISIVEKSTSHPVGRLVIIKYVPSMVIGLLGVLITLYLNFLDFLPANTREIVSSCAFYIAIFSGAFANKCIKTFFKTPYKRSKDTEIQEPKLITRTEQIIRASEGMGYLGLIPLVIYFGMSTLIKGEESLTVLAFSFLQQVATDFFYQVAKNNIDRNVTKEL